MTVTVIDTLPIKHLQLMLTFRVGLTPAPTCLRGKVVKLMWPSKATKPIAASSPPREGFFVSDGLA